ncbi:CD225/dispanin family protein [Rhodococcus sp. HNM0569]|uniref:CD225/dispanin family protein n=1 Tax=Rhodococcus sp. HNM0569 TaxID=2716340 RepID=UPI00146A6455|nr:CD225/dispanin family protein [Rhodococcus sp. HNM0569]NLU83799.1 CD225/dispanin family protein [Rhodococcus sp. HNM0569]
MTETPGSGDSSNQYGSGYPQYQAYGSTPSGQQYPAYGQGQQSGYGYQGATTPAGAPPLPPSNAGWAVAAVLFFWPVAFSAFNHVHQVYPRWAMGDYQGAQYASDRAKYLGKLSLWIFIGLWVLLIVFYVVVIAAIVSSTGSSTSDW